MAPPASEIQLSAKGVQLSAKGVQLSASRVVRIATDCSGIDVPVAMLEDIIHSYGSDLSIQHVFSSEIDPAARAIIEHNFAPKFIFVISQTEL